LPSFEGKVITRKKMGGKIMPHALKYTEEHEWVKLDGEIATVGISTHATEELGDIVFVELPKLGSEINQLDEFGSVESVKAVSSLFLPLGGEIVEINNEVVKEPALINESPYEDGWLVKVKVADKKEYDDLLTYEEYKNFVSTNA
jgi:glycine cleavage system H protein